MKEMMMNLVAMDIENKIGSRVEGRRNWVIRVETLSNGKRIVSYCGGFGEAVREGWMSASLTKIGKKKIRWYEFTYKKDYMNALSKLADIGIN